jgi:hypothetical protein
MLSLLSTPMLGVTLARWLWARVLAEDYAMTTQIIYLTTQIQHWLNQRVARHLAAQAERLEPVKH